MRDLNEEHVEAIYRILWYLKLTLGKDLYPKKSTGIKIYSDANWARSIVDLRSTSN